MGRVGRRHPAILGAGMQGCCIALELARRGHRVDLYDRCSEPATQAAAWNEGKIHLGLVYANDPTAQTHHRMLPGALCFESYLRRWIEGPVPSRSTPFQYAVHRSSILNPAEIEAHFAAVRERYDALRRELSLDYLGVTDEPFYEALSAAERAETFGEDRVQAAFRTIERAVNPRAIAKVLRAAIAAESMITFHGDVEIEAVEPVDGHGYEVVGRREGASVRQVYRDVVNALWSGRLAIDSRVGHRYDRSWLYRYKLGIIMDAEPGRRPIPSTTFMLGSYGDTVHYDDGTIYISWYPDCLVGTSSAIAPPDFSGQLDDAQRRAAAQRSIEAMAELVPALEPYRDGASASAMIGGGIIFAWGAADIDDPRSELHRRYDIGVHSEGRYHSVDTGKYTMAPYFAVETCDRIEGLR